MYDLSDFGLCCGTLAGADFRTLAEAAGGAGFRSISLWPSHYEDAIASGLDVTDMRSILADNGLTITELDPLCSWLPTPVASDDLAARFYAYAESDFFRIADALGARTLNVIQASNAPIPRAEVIDRLGLLCDRAARHGLLVSVEFMPWSPIGDLTTALDLVKATGRRNCGINLDTWHHARSGGTIDDLKDLPASRVAALQLNDVAAEPWADPLEETALGRRLPGQGAGDTRGVLEALHRAGVHVPINVEVFSADLQKLDSAEAARAVAHSVRSVLARRTR